MEPRPEHIGRPVIAAGGEVLAAVEKGLQPAGIRRPTVTEPLTVSPGDDDPVGFEGGGDPVAQNGQRIGMSIGARLGHLGAELEQGLRRIRPIARRLAHRLDGDTVDRPDLGDQQLLRRSGWDRDHEFVDDLAATAFEDVDRQHVSAHCTDPTGDEPECSGAVGQPQSQNKGGAVDRRVSGHRRTSAQFREAATKIANPLGDALLVLDQCEADESLTTRAEPDTGRQGDVGVAHER